MKTVIVDDDQINRERVHLMLASAGHDCQLFETADSAAAALSEPGCAVDLVVTDVQMPGELDGIDLATLLTLIRPGLPVVVMSSSRAELDRALARGLAVPTLEKPIMTGALLAAVASATGSQSQSRSTSPNASGDAVRERPLAIADPRPLLTTMFREAAATGHPHVGTEHVALAALDGPGGFSDLAVRSGLDPKGLRRGLVECCVEPASRREPGLTFRAASVVAAAAQLAVLDGAPELRSRDLVAALLATPTVLAWAGLTAGGLDHALALEASYASATKDGAPSRRRLS